MSTWTWTFVKPEHLSKKQIESLLNYAITYCGGVYYDNYKKHGWDYALKDWLDMHKENYNYYVKECEVPETQMTEKYLTKELKEKIENCKYKIECYNKVLSGEMTFREMLENTKEDSKFNNVYNHDFYVIKRNNDIYVNIKFEWWRNKRDSENEFYTVESLIEEVKKSKLLSYYDDETKQWIEEEQLSPKLEKKLRDFYGAIGDNNFYVHFG